MSSYTSNWLDNKSQHQINLNYLFLLDNYYCTIIEVCSQSLKLVNEKSFQKYLTMEYEIGKFYDTAKISNSQKTKTFLNGLKKYIT